MSKTIEELCEKHGIENYIINDDGSIDVNGGVYIQNSEFTKLPLKFNKVSGDFSCYNNELTSLDSKTFSKLNKLERLWLWQNWLTSIEPSTFNPKPNDDIVDSGFPIKYTEIVMIL